MELTEASIAQPSQQTGKVPLTVLIPALNEEVNLRSALMSSSFADEVIVVDSNSTDRTVEIAESEGATVVQFDYRGVGPKKQNWMLQTLTFRNDWVFILDADERFTPELQDAITSAIAGDEHDGYLIDRDLVFMGRSLRCLRPNYRVQLFKHTYGYFEDLGLNDLPSTGDNEIHEHVQLQGRLGILKPALLHEDDRGLTPWIARHNNYSTWEAYLYLKFRAEPIGTGLLQFMRLDPLNRKRVLRRIWVRLPLRTPLRFFTWYVLRGGFLDGLPGFVYCVLLAYHEFQIWAKIREIKANGRSLV